MFPVQDATLRSRAVIPSFRPLFMAVRRSSQTFVEYAMGELKWRPKYSSAMLCSSSSSVRKARNHVRAYGLRPLHTVSQGRHERCYERGEVHVGGNRHRHHPGWHRRGIKSATNSDIVFSCFVTASGPFATLSCTSSLGWRWISPGMLKPLLAMKYYCSLIFTPKVSRLLRVRLHSRGEQTPRGFARLLLLLQLQLLLPLLLLRFV